MTFIRRFSLGALPALALAACSQEPVPSATEEAADAASAAPSEAAAPLPSKAATASPAEVIPVSARGRWGLVPADCTSTRGDAKGLLTIDATTLKFYESVGRLTKVAEGGETRLGGTFAFSGEGMDWTREEVLDVQDGGKTLIRRESGEDAQPGPFKYTRC